jgi:hypothetical protein
MLEFFISNSSTKWCYFEIHQYKATNEKRKQNKNSGALVRQRTIPTERPSLVGEVSANFSG